MATRSNKSPEPVCTTRHHAQHGCDPNSCKECTQQVLTSRMRRRQESGNTTSTHSSDMTTRPSPPVSHAGAPPGSSSWTCGEEVCVRMKRAHCCTGMQGLPPSSSCCTRTQGAGKRDQQRDGRP